MCIKTSIICVALTLGYDDIVLTKVFVIWVHGNIAKMNLRHMRQAEKKPLFSQII